MTKFPNNDCQLWIGIGLWRSIIEYYLRFGVWLLIIHLICSLSAWRKFQITKIKSQINSKL